MMEHNAKVAFPRLHYVVKLNDDLVSKYRDDHPLEFPLRVGWHEMIK